jgi:peptidoglycan/LPS O-acetylase OafA/YrhL
LKQENRVYFKGLDGLRAIGALSLFFQHIELSKKYNVA